jgi:hypothetical protein
MSEIFNKALIYCCGEEVREEQFDYVDSDEERKKEKWKKLAAIRAVKESK